MTQSIQLDNLRHSVFFRKLSQSDLEEVAKHCEAITLNAGEILFEQDSEPDAIYFLEEGEVQVIRRYPEGYEVVIATEAAPYVIGEISMLANKVRTGRVFASQDCRMIKLNREDIWRICESEASIAMDALRSLGGRLYRLNLRVRENAVSNVSARVASLLLLLSENDTPIHNTVESISQMARASAANIDVIARLLNQWAEYEIIDLNEETIVVRQAGALRSLAG